MGIAIKENLIKIDRNAIMQEIIALPEVQIFRERYKVATHEDAHTFINAIDAIGNYIFKACSEQIWLNSQRELDMSLREYVNSVAELFVILFKDFEKNKIILDNTPVILYRDVGNIITRGMKKVGELRANRLHLTLEEFNNKLKETWKSWGVDVK